MLTRNIDQYKKLHKAEVNYGRSGDGLVELIFIAFMDRIKKAAMDRYNLSILDYGCGKSTACISVSSNLGCTPHLYDPALDEFSNIPGQKFDFIINTDVLEHLDEAEIDPVIKEISLLSENVFFQIATSKSADVLPSGENAHATVKDQKWWKEKLQKHFSIISALPSKRRRCAFVTWKPSHNVTLSLQKKLIKQKLLSRVRRFPRKFKNLFY
jgi:hypothetical protein